MRHARLRTLVLALVLALVPSISAMAWDSPGHELVAGIAWDNMTNAARQQVIAMLQKAPQDACLRDLFPNDSRPPDVRQREFFMRAATWPDVVRPKPGGGDTRPCIRFHQESWHFEDHFWQGFSGETGKDAPSAANIQTPAVNAVERLSTFRHTVLCDQKPCAAVVCDVKKNPCTTDEDRAMQLAWMLHLVGDIHQPLHTASHVTDKHPQGDRGGNLFLFTADPHGPQLHGFWDHIIDDTVKPQTGEKGTDIAYLDRVIKDHIVSDHPKATLAAGLKPGDFEAWSQEGFAAAEANAYPKGFDEGTPPSDAYKQNAFTIADRAIAIGGYRLADLLNQMFPAPK